MPARFPIRSTFATAAFASLAGSALAQTPAPAPMPEHTITANVGLFSECIFGRVLPI